MKKLLGIVVLGLLWCNISCAEKVNIYDFEFPDRKPYEFQLFKKLISFKPNTYGYNNEEILKRAIKNIPFLCRSGSYSGYASLHDTSVLEGIEEILNNPNKPLHEFNFRFPKNCKNSRTPNGVRLMPFIKSKKYIFSKTYLSAVWVNRKKFLNANVPTNRGMEGFPHYDIFLYRFLNIPIDEKTKEKLLKVSNNTGVVNREAFANIIKVLDDSKKTQTAKKEPSQMQGVATNNEEIYFACLNVMVKDRSTIDNFQPGEEYGFQYFKLDSNNSEITVHEQIYDDKPEKIGSIKISMILPGNHLFRIHLNVDFMRLQIIFIT